jgi:hypothetical protein
LPLINFASAGVILLLLWRIGRDNRFAVIPIFLPFLILIWEVVSVAYLELGAYSPELQFTTRQTGATLRLVFALSCFLMAYWLVFRAIVSRKWLAQMPNDTGGSDNVEALAWWMTAAAIATAFLLLANIPPGVLESRSRALVEHPSFLRDKLLAYHPIVGLVLGFAAGVTARSRTRLLSYAGFALHLLTLYLYGNKFSGLLAFVFPFALSFLPLVYRLDRERTVFGLGIGVQVAIASTFVAAMIGMGIYRYFIILESAAHGYVMTRVFVLQGGMWWFTDYTATHGSYLPGPRSLIDFTVAQNFHPNSGLMYLMTRAIGWNLTKKIFFVDVSLYTGTFPSLFYVLGAAGPPSLCAFLGVVIGSVSAYLTRKILRLQLWRMLLALTLFLPVFSLLDPGEFTQLYSIAFPVKLAAILLAEFVLYTIALPVADAFEGS